ncbi:hypothethical protein (plasmid) [Ralstonia solanacearum CMR15]|nr:hypothethical protein [Ralstonia solanacearum CMR15]
MPSEDGSGRICRNLVALMQIIVAAGAS